MIQIFMEHWTGFKEYYAKLLRISIPEYVEEAIKKMMECGDEV